MSGTAAAALQGPVQAETPEFVESVAGGRGTLLAVVPVNNGSSRLAIVGYLLPPPAGQSSGPRPAEPSADGLVVDTARHRAVVRGHDAGLTFQEFELLTFLAANPGQVFTRKHLLERAWGDVYQGARTVDVHIHRLRRKLGSPYARSLVTVRRVGYMYQQFPDSS